VEDLLDVPQLLAPGAAISKVALFRLNPEVLQGSEIESYTVTVIDSHGREASREVILIREI